MKVITFDFIIVNDADLNIYKCQKTAKHLKI